METTKLKSTVINSDSLGNDLSIADKLINAYFDGFADGREHISNETFELIKRNLRDASKFTGHIQTFLKSIGITSEDLFVRVTSIIGVDVLVSVNENDYLRPEFSEVYESIVAQETEYNNESLHISLSFVLKNEYFNSEEILSDGFVMIPKINEA